MLWIADLLFGKDISALQSHVSLCFARRFGITIFLYNHHGCLLYIIRLTALYNRGHCAVFLGLDSAWRRCGWNAPGQCFPAKYICLERHFLHVWMDFIEHCGKALYTFALFLYNVFANCIFWGLVLTRRTIDRANVSARLLVVSKYFKTDLHFYLKSMLIYTRGPRIICATP